MVIAGDSRKGNVVGALVVFCMVLLVAHAEAIDLPDFKYGSLKRDKEVTRSFETYEILPDYKYYYCGWGNIPYAIIGIHKSYQLRQGLWKDVSLTTQILRSWVSQMDIIYGFRPYGSLILDHSGKPVGIWYSSKQQTTIIVEENNEVAVFTPEAPGFRGGK